MFDRRHVGVEVDLHQLRSERNHLETFGFRQPGWFEVGRDEGRRRYGFGTGRGFGTFRLSGGRRRLRTGVRLRVTCPEQAGDGDGGCKTLVHGKPLLEVMRWIRGGDGRYGPLPCGQVAKQEADRLPGSSLVAVHAGISLASGLPRASVMCLVTVFAGNGQQPHRCGAAGSAVMRLPGHQRGALHKVMTRKHTNRE